LDGKTLILPFTRSLAMHMLGAVVAMHDSMPFNGNHANDTGASVSHNSRPLGKCRGRKQHQANCRR
jgi:hypothetical protein